MLNRKYIFNQIQLWIFGITCVLYGTVVAYSLWIPAIILAIVMIVILLWTSEDPTPRDSPR